jgi:hypothetical protein
MTEPTDHQIHMERGLQWRAGELHMPQVRGGEHWEVAKDTGAGTGV